MPSPFVHSLLPTACLAATEPSLRLDKKSGVRLLFLSVFLANAPDLDIFYALAFAPDKVRYYHRFLGHNLIALLLFTAIGIFVCRKWAAPALSRLSAVAISVSLVFSHVLLDSLCDVDPLTHVRSGIPFFWPFSEVSYNLPYRLFGKYILDEKKGTVMSHLTSVTFWKNMFTRELMWTLIIFGMWCVLWSAITGAVKITKRQLSKDTSVEQDPVKAA